MYFLSPPGGLYAENNRNKITDNIYKNIFYRAKSLQVSIKYSNCFMLAAGAGWERCTMDLSYLRSKWIRHTQGDIQAEISAWDSVAEDYVPDGDVTLQKDPFLALLHNKGILTKDMRVLDVGCGAGAYTIALAGAVGEARGVDFSPKMIEAAKRSARERKIKNVDFFERDWSGCPGDEFAGKYDLVFAHTTPAISDYETLVKLMDASKRYCALCKPARRTDEVFDQVRRLAGDRRSSNDDSVVYAFGMVWGYGYNPEISYQETVWKSGKTLEEAERWYLGRMKGTCAIDDRTEAKIRDFLKEISVDGIVSETIHTMLVNLFWEK